MKFHSMTEKQYGLVKRMYNDNTFYSALYKEQKDMLVYTRHIVEVENKSVLYDDDQRNILNGIRSVWVEYLRQDR